jgi:ethanolamine utilization protein EutN
MGMLRNGEKPVHGQTSLAMAPDAAAKRYPAIRAIRSEGKRQMYYGRVVGSATATMKHPSMEGCKLLLVMALQADGRSIEGDPILVVDTLGAGEGEKVMITSDGIRVRELLGDNTSPVRWTVLGITD